MGRWDGEAVHKLAEQGSLKEPGLAGQGQAWMGKRAQRNSAKVWSERVLVVGTCLSPENRRCRRPLQVDSHKPLGAAEQGFKASRGDPSAHALDSPPSCLGVPWFPRSAGPRSC